MLSCVIFMKFNFPAPLLLRLGKLSLYFSLQRQQTGVIGGKPQALLNLPQAPLQIPLLEQLFCLFPVLHAEPYPPDQQ